MKCIESVTSLPESTTPLLSKSCLLTPVQCRSPVASQSTPPSAHSTPWSFLIPVDFNQPQCKMVGNVSVVLLLCNCCNCCWASKIYHHLYKRNIVFITHSNTFSKIGHLPNETAKYNLVKKFQWLLPKYIFHVELQFEQVKRYQS